MAMKKTVLMILVVVFFNRITFANPPYQISNHFLIESNSSVYTNLDLEIGRSLFERIWVAAPASTQAGDGLGPLYNAHACHICHQSRNTDEALNGTKNISHQLVVRINMPAANKVQQRLLAENKITHIPDPVYGSQLQYFAIAGHSAEGQLEVNYDETIVKLSDGEEVSLRRPSYQIKSLNYGPLHEQVMLSVRLGPKLHGLGFLQAIEEQTILAKEDAEDNNDDGISGRANWVWDYASDKIMLGRFGHKASMPTLEQQIQSAFVTDLGLSVPMYQKAHGDCTVSQTDCVQARHGDSSQYDNLEVHQTIIDYVHLYLSNIEVTQTSDNQVADVEAGEKLFHQIGCQSCHTAEYQLPNNVTLKAIHQKTIKPYTDLLLHDMGPGLADHFIEGEASGHEWRTAPLWGISQRLNGYFLHDGRARNILEAILWHGGEAQQQRDIVIALEREQRKQLIAFIESL